MANSDAVTVATIRPANKNDVDARAQMRNELWPSTVEQHKLEVKAQMLDSDFVVFIAEKDGRALGFAEASVRKFANGCDSSPVPFVEGLWVEPQFRKRGIGRQLISAVEEWARDRGFSEVGSDAFLSNTESHSAHKAWGFEETERVVYFRKKL